MKIHEMLVNELLTQAGFRSLFLEYARERVGEASLLPVSEWPFPDDADPAPVPVPVATGWRAMTAQEIIQEGDQWAPLADPERWRPVGDSVGRQVGQFKKSRFRCPADREVAEGPELRDPVRVAPFPPTSYARGPSDEGLAEYTDVEMREFPLPGDAILWNGDVVPGPGVVGDSDGTVTDAAGTRNPYMGVTRPYLYAVTCEGRRATAGEGYRILWPDEKTQEGDEWGYDGRLGGWTREHCVDHASGSLHFTIKIHRRRIEWGPVVVSTPLHDGDWLAEPPSPLFRVPTHVIATPPPEPVAQSDAERRRSWRLLEPHEVAIEGDRYARPGRTEFVGLHLGRTAAEILSGGTHGCGIEWPVIRPIVRSRDGYTAHNGTRIMDPTETVPPAHMRFTQRHNGIDFGSAITGELVGDSIIFIDIVEVENA